MTDSNILRTRTPRDTEDYLLTEGTTRPFLPNDFTSTSGLALPPFTQTASSMINRSREQFLTHSPPIDRLLDGGLKRGNMLEISGPPGTLKESVALGVVRSFISAREEVIFVDMQNMTSPATLYKNMCSLSESDICAKLIYHINIQNLQDLSIFLHHFPSLLARHEKVTLCVLNSISFPFHTAPELTTSAKTAFLERLKRVLTVASASRGLTVVTTSQLATKMINPDGSTGNFDSGAKGVMVPQLGPSYLPAGKCHRIMIAPESKQTGIVKLLSTSDERNKNPLRCEPYTIVEGALM